MRGLKFFTRTNDKHWWNIASYHDPNSITWSWILSFGTRKPDERWNWYFFHAHRGNQGLQWDLCLVGCRLNWQTQNKMPYSRRIATARCAGCDGHECDDGCQYPGSQ